MTKKIPQPNETIRVKMLTIKKVNNNINTVCVSLFLILIFSCCSRKISLDKLSKKEIEFNQLPQAVKDKVELFILISENSSKDTFFALTARNLIHIKPME